MSFSTEPMTNDESTLIRQALAGSREAFGELVRSHHAAVRWQLARVIQDLATVDDLAQEVFLEAYERLDSFQGSGSLRGWLGGIARNKAKEFVRNDTRRKAREQGTMARQLAQWRLDQLESRPEEAEEFELLSRALKGCIAALAPRSRQLVEAHYFEASSLESLGRQQGRSGGSIRMMLFRIRKALAECVRSQLPEEG